MTFNMLTVAELDGDSESMAAEQSQFSWNPGIQPGQDKLLIKIDLQKNLTIRLSRDHRIQNTIQFAGVDINSLIEFLQEVKVFHDEEEMIAKLKGKQNG